MLSSSNSIDLLSWGSPEYFVSSDKICSKPILINPNLLLSCWFNEAGSNLVYTIYTGCPPGKGLSAKKPNNGVG